MTKRCRAAAAAWIGLAAGACAPGDEPGPESAAAGGEMGAPSDAPSFESANPYDLGFTDADFPRVRELAPDVYSYEQIHAAGGETITTVSLFVVTPAGVLVADGQESPEETGRLVDAIGEVTDRPITHVVICSDHGDHTGGNSAFPAGAELIAHPTSAAALEAARADRDPEAPPAALPTRLVEDELTLDLGGREIRILHLGRAHTGGDLVVHVPEGKVLFMSETFLNRIFPAMRSAYPSEWAAMIDRALAMDVDVYVPGHGMVESPEELRRELVTYRDALARVIAEARRLHEAGWSAEEALERADFGELEAWTLRASQAGLAIGRVYLELEGALPR